MPKISSYSANTSPPSTFEFLGTNTADTSMGPTGTTEIVTLATILAQVPQATATTLGLVQLTGDLGGTATSPVLEKIKGVALSSPSGGATSYLNATGAWTVPSGGGGGSSVLDWVSVITYGADPTGAADSTTAFKDAVAALPSGGGIVYAPAGTYLISGTVTFKQNQGLVGDGHSATVINYTGSGVCVSSALSGTFNGNAEGGYFSGWQVSAYNGGASAIGMQVTDLQGVACYDVSFYGCGGAGLSMTTGGSGWSEEGWFYKVAAIQCGTAGSNTTGSFVFNSTSFDYGVYDFTAVSNPGAHVIVVRNGVNMNGVRLACRGNAYDDTPNTAALLAIEPGNANGTGYVTNSDIMISMETAGSGTGHYLLLMGSTNSASQFSGSGVLSLYPAFGNGQGISNPNFLPAGFSGVINDGAGTVMASGDGQAVMGGSVKLVAGVIGSALGNTVYSEFGDIWVGQLANGANALSFTSWLAWGREIDLFLQQPASGAAGTVTWPANVKWPGGTAPALSTASNEVDWIKLKWLGTANGYATGALIAKGYTL